ncbi:hypothetical protein PEX2_020490 [Penicillium expansum]|uniref:DUF1746 domain-containing protein n=1 Tax=Penicillium expansum TaxID=27334 RepID=A0A0A2JZJ6_PENEN|nr:hypothetical protein PEX2_020490 [Penicillium expansum]KGO57605.1 hypothetical protein PEX2_020490 [Penicillium expansum]
MTDVDAYRDAEYIADVSGISYDDAEPPRPTGTLRSQNARVKKIKSTAKVAFIDRLLRDLDILIYCQLSALYYMDCSIVLFAIRAIVELIFFTPKAPPFEPTRSQPFVGAIIGSNLICMLFHAFLRVKTNGTPTPAPTMPNPNPPADTPADTSPNAEDSQPQDHDAEERGVLRQEDSDETVSPAQYSSDSHHSSGIDEEVEEERTTLLADPADTESGSGARGEHPMDTFAAGEAVILSMSFLGTIRDQWRQSNSAARPTSGFVPSPETATFLRQRFGLQVGTNGRIERANTT